MPSDDENVIMKLSVGPDSGCAPDAYNECDPQFSLQPCDMGFSLHHSMSFTDEAVPKVPDREEDEVGRGRSHDLTSPSGLRVIRLLTEFEEKSKTGEWPSSTRVHCYWCCHKFDNAPYGLPIKYALGQFHVTGCFCSLECACAYNFASRESVDECMNRSSLINMLSARIGHGGHVRPAPDRLALDIFGGHMSIKEFRGFYGTPRQVLLNSPPMLAVTQQVEEVNESDMRSEYKYIPLDSERVTRYQEKIRLKRTKPLVNFRNTLDHSMNLKYDG